MPRRVVNPAGFRFAVSTVLAHDTFVEVVAMERHYDSELCNAPNKFDSFRFSRLREGQRRAGSVFTHSVVTNSLDYLAFGHGGHTCPGKSVKFLGCYGILNHLRCTFFAATELTADGSTEGTDEKLLYWDISRIPHNSISS